jgi:hypothetical protein
MRRDVTPRHIPEDAVPMPPPGEMAGITQEMSKKGSKLSVRHFLDKFSKEYSYTRSKAIQEEGKEENGTSTK